MKIYVSFDGDGIGRKIGQSALGDQEDQVRKISDTITQGNKIFTDFAISHLGSVISSGGDEGRICLPAEAVVKLPELRQEYERVTGATVSVGIGLSMSQADKSLLVAKHKGKDQIVMYEPAVEKELENIKLPTEDEKLNEAYLEGNHDSQPAPQADIIHSLNENRDATQPSELDAQLHELNEEIRSHTVDGQLADLNEEMKGHTLDGQLEQVNAKNPPPAQQQDEDQQQTQPEQTEQDPGPQAHEEVSPEDEGHDTAQVDQPVTVLSLIADTLTKVKAQAPYIEGLKQHNPQAYNAIRGIIQAMLAMAHELMGGGDDGDDQGQPQNDQAGGGDSVGDGMSGLHNASAKKYHRVTFPVGTEKNGKVKVRFPDGHTGWVSATAGAILGQGGQAISSKTTRQERISGAQSDFKNE